ncbi:eukaryotic aspartyl protease [Ancylostoma duodenale]|uniref:Eukaryotic aspartyl protease n=1 Tax=Ancylostoma duodenale TaxID=51022 RepID=A0A0C2H1F7_9BILA|nr:eukaryotic aspartyl protease [Ancylostoma duodenale]
MWITLVLANTFLLSAVRALNMTVELHGTGSLIAKFIKANRYDYYLRVLEEQERNRTKGRYWTWQALASWYDEFYLGEVKVGTPPQKFLLAMDTGSSAMWLIDGACTHPICNGYPNSGRTKNKFYYGESITFKRTSDHFSLNYGSGWAGGFTGADDISYGTFIVKQQQFGVANSLGPFFGTAPMDGIFGLGFNEYPNLNAPMPTVKHFMDKEQFTVWMNRRVAISRGAIGGYITYGQYDKTNCEPQIYYAPLAVDNKWIINIAGFSIGSFTHTANQHAISDTGTTWIGVPNAVLNNILWQTQSWWDPNRKLYIIPCSKMWTLPRMIFHIAGRKFTVPSVQYVLDLNLGNGQCVMAMFAVDSAAFGAQFILGQPFIRTFCQTYDMANKRIGISVARPQKT